MRETVIERRLKRELEKCQGLALKFTSLGWNGAPDRIVLLCSYPVGVFIL